MKLRRMRSSAGLCCAWSRMKRSITSTADGRCARITGVAASASSSLANSNRQHRLGFGSGTRLSFAASTTPSVPSEPTISLARLNGAPGSTNSSRL